MKTKLQYFILIISPYVLHQCLLHKWNGSSKHRKLISYFCRLFITQNTQSITVISHWSAIFFISQEGVRTQWSKNLAVLKLSEKNEKTKTLICSKCFRDRFGLYMCAWVCVLQPCLFYVSAYIFNTFIVMCSWWKKKLWQQNQSIAICCQGESVN